MNEYEFMLQDRIAKIQSINEQYDLLNNSYIAFSGGKDSTILHYLIDMALPNNKIPRVFANTGLEFQAIRKFVQDLAKNDERFQVVNNKLNIKQTLEKYGYPFKSKEFARFVHTYWNMQEKGLQVCDNLQKRIDRNDDCYDKVPKKLLYLFDNKPNINISHYCCVKMKKEPTHMWEKMNKKKMVITGMRKDEGGARKNITCISDKGKKFNPLAIVDENWENWFIAKYNIKLCELYYPPFNFKRTGCKGCPFNLQLQKDLDVMKELLPNEYKQCEIIWKPIYKEYRRLNYRLTNKEQMGLNDFIDTKV